MRIKKLGLSATLLFAFILIGAPMRSIADEPAELQLLRLASNKFGGDITQAEEKMFKAAATGEIAYCTNALDDDTNAINAANWGSARVIRAERLRWLCTDPKATKLVTYHGVLISDARVESPLELEWANVEFPLGAFNSSFSHIDIQYARLRSLFLIDSTVLKIWGAGLVLQDELILRRIHASGELNFCLAKTGNNFDCEGATFANPYGICLNADGLQVNGVLNLTSVISQGEIRLLNAVIGQQLVCNGGRFTNNGDYSLSIDGANISGSVSLQKLESDGGIRLTGATIGGTLNCESAHIRNGERVALDFDSAKIGGSVFLRYGFLAEGQVRLPLATIDGNLDCQSAHFICTNSIALEFGGAKIRGGVLLTEHSCVNGLLMCVGSEIGGNLECSGAAFINGGENALGADRARIGGDVYLNNGFNSTANVRLPQATIGGSLVCSSGHFKNSGGPALAFDEAKVGQNVRMDEGFVAEGEVSLAGAIIGGQAICNSGCFSNVGGVSLQASFATIQNSILLRDGFVSKGKVWFMGANIGQDFDCQNGLFDNPRDFAIDATRINIAGNVFLTDGFRANGLVTFEAGKIGSNLELRNVALPNSIILDLRMTRVRTLSDDSKDWPAAGQLNLDGFHYEGIAGTSPVDSESRIHWLRLQPQNAFVPQPYEELASVLRRMGHEDAAARVMLQKNRDYAEHLKWYSLARLWYNLIGCLAGYGYLPGRAFIISVGCIAFGTVVFRFARRSHLLLPADEGAWSYSEDFIPHIHEGQPSFSAFLYSLEMFVPLVKLGLGDCWRPYDGRETPLQFLGKTLSVKGKWVRWYLMLHVAAGWLLTTLWIGALTGLVKT